MSHFQVSPTRLRVRKVEEHYRVEHRSPATWKWTVLAVAKRRKDAMEMARRLVAGVGRKAA